GTGPDGPETASRILARKTLPIVFLTSHTEREYVERVRKITRYGYVVKNAGDFVLESAIEMAFTLFEAHETLREANEELNSIYLNAPFHMFLLTHDGIVHKVNDFALQQSSTRFVGEGRQHIGDLLRCLGSIDAPEGCGAGPLCRFCILRSDIIKVFDGGEDVLDAEFRLEVSPGPAAKAEEVLYQYSVVRLQNVDLQKVLVTLQDITAKRQIEEHLRQSQEAFSTLVENADEGIYLMLDGRYTYVNEGFCQLTGYLRDELLSAGFDYNTLLDSNSMEQVESRRLARLRGERLSGLFRLGIVCKDGTKLDVEVSTTTIGDPSSRTIAGIMRPIRSSQENSSGSQLGRQGTEL
ncbi:MAG: PAS domain S-box protein, partial [Spirochaetota bacterium]